MGLGHVLLRVLAHAVDRLRPRPQHHPAEMVRVPVDLRVEEVDGRPLGGQELLGVVEVLPRLRDHPVGVVVELLVLVPGDDVPRLERLDLVDRVPPRPEAAARGLRA
jgi:hypothetical protein